MTNKLFKMQFREAWRAIGPIAAIGLLILLIGNVVAILIPQTFIRSFILMISVIAAMGLPFVFSLIILYHDYHNMHGKRAYFVRSIPAKDNELFWSRFFYHFVSTLIIFVISILYVGILAMFSLKISGTAFGEVKKLITEFFFQLPVWLLISLFLFILLSSASSTIDLMASISLGSEARFNNMGLGGPLLMYFIIYLINNVGILLFMLFTPVSLAFNVHAKNISEFNFHIVWEGLLKYFIEEIKGNDTGQVGLISLGFILYMIFSSVVLGILCNRSMKNKLSLK